MPARKHKLQISFSVKVLLIIYNIVIVSLFVGLMIYYITDDAARKEETARQSFSAAVTSMENVAFGYLTAQQRSCNDWARYIDDHPMTVAEASEYIGSTNTVDYITADIIDYETKKGLSAEHGASASVGVDYSFVINKFEDVISELENITENPVGHIYISGSYTLPVNARQAVGFCSNVKLLDESGNAKEYLLIRAVSVEWLKAIWVFPDEYVGAQLSLILGNGTYIIRDDSLRDDNFWEFLRINNGLSENDVAALKTEMINTNDPFRLKNSVGGESFYVCHNTENRGKLMVVGSVPVESLISTSPDMTMAGLTFIGLLLIFIVDGAYIMRTNNMLADSAEETRRASLAKTKFLSSMSHDIRTPLNAIVGMTTIASKHIDDPERVSECLKKINLASNHLLTLINDILDISKIESGKMNINPIVFSIAESVTKLVDIIRPQVREKKLAFEIHILKLDHEYLYADELRLNQIFLNLLSNAIKYTNYEGRVVVDMSITVSENDPAKVKLVYSVKDTGIGMEKEFMDKMYSAFTRAVDTRIDKIQGTGLGLAITKQLVDLMGGTIECESIVGVGTTFVVTLELTAADKMTDELMLPPMRMLLVDDDAIFRETAKETLSSLGITADLADSGAKAVSMAVAENEAGRGYPFIITDWKMPDMDGIATAKALREKLGKDIPIVIISSYDWAEVEEDALAAGVNGFISKPFFRSDIYNVISKFLKTDDENIVVEEDIAEGLRGCTILVAEDNDLNWEIVCELLAMYDITADRAENGRECVEMLEKAESGKYAGVLMDVQMPVMDGKKAATEIRKLSDAEKAGIPIIAMTADAFAEDVKSCIKAGMNAHVSKPIDIKKLFNGMRSAGVNAAGRR